MQIVKSRSVISENIVKHLARLARLPIGEKRFGKLQKDLEASFEYVNKIQSLDTKKTQETSQVTGQENVLRNDVVDKSRILTQQEVLSNAPNSHNGFIKVSAIFENE